MVEQRHELQLRHIRVGNHCGIREPSMRSVRRHHWKRLCAVRRSKSGTVRQDFDHRNFWECTGTLRCDCGHYHLRKRRFWESVSVGELKGEQAKRARVGQRGVRAESREYEKAHQMKSITDTVLFEKQAATLLPSLFQQTSNIPPFPL
mmetsp:Transcript_2829/g.17612  ORF Transcript_2829/g.17612 Transcript_2829/m.17612 type:complete len:148 (+) Transcript_2829:357-800(+)